MSTEEFQAPDATALRRAEQFAFARIAIGAGLLIAPGAVLRPWIGSDAGSAGARWLARGMGGRDLALGVGLLLAVRHGAPVRGWLEAGVLADTTDGLAALLALRGLPRGRGAAMVAAAAGGAVAGRRIVATLSPEPGHQAVQDDRGPRSGRLS